MRANQIPKFFDFENLSFRERRVRSVVIQILTLFALLWFGYEIVDNTITNLEKRNIASGFAFLESTAGFGLAQSLIPYSEESSYGRAFLVGLCNTLLVAVLGIILATVLGFIVGIARLSRNWLIARLATIFVEIARNIPPLLHLFIWYFAVLLTLPRPRGSFSLGGIIFLNNRGLFAPWPVFGEGAGWLLIASAIGLVGALGFHVWRKRVQIERGHGAASYISLLGYGLPLLALPAIALVMTGFPISFDVPALKGFNFTGGIKIIPEFVALLFALSIYTAAYIAEIVRAGILSVSAGQTEAAYALGLRPLATLRYVVIPQAMRAIIPALTNQFLNLTKNSSLAVAIAYPDLVYVFAGVVLNQTGQAVEIIAITMGVYLTISLLTAGVMNWINAKMALVDQ